MKTISKMARQKIEENLHVAPNWRAMFLRDTKILRLKLFS